MKINLNGTEIDLGDGKVVQVEQTPIYSEDGLTHVHTLFKITFKSAEAA
jgi:hypothetical protein